MKHDAGMTRRRWMTNVGVALGTAHGAALASVAAAQEPAGSPPPPLKPDERKPLIVPAWCYQHFDADYALAVPEEGFGGWKKADLELSRDHTALVSMHAWDAGTREEFPGWWRVVPYIPRANAIVREVYPRLLAAIRASGLPLFHVVGGGDYYKDLPGYKHAVEIAGPPPAPLPSAASDPVRDALAAFRNEHGFPSGHNTPDINRGFARLDFPAEARPQGEEGIAENGHQLFALCKERGINHLVYFGFAINWCLLLSPGGMAEMVRYGVMCSALRQATTAVENKESAPKEWCKELALWRVSLAFGLVYDVDGFIAAVHAS